MSTPTPTLTLTTTSVPTLTTTPIPTPIPTPILTYKRMRELPRLAQSPPESLQQFLTGIKLVGVHSPIWTNLQREMSRSSNDCFILLFRTNSMVIGITMLPSSSLCVFLSSSLQICALTMRLVLGRACIAFHGAFSLWLGMAVPHSGRL